MLNEKEEFLSYTGVPVYASVNKQDYSYLGRIAFATMLDFQGLPHIFGIIARGYMYGDEDANISRARKALCAWCSIPDKKENAAREDWQYKSDFRELHGEFPGLVTEDGQGWFYRHVHCVADYILNNPDKTSKSAHENAVSSKNGFDREWRNKVIQFQIPIFSENTKGAWIVRFDDILADALESGELKVYPEPLSKDISDKISAAVPEQLREKVSYLIAYYLAHKPVDSDWAVLPVISLDAYFGGTAFSKKILSRLPEDIIIRDRTGYGISRYKVSEKLISDELQRREVQKVFGNSVHTKD